MVIRGLAPYLCTQLFLLRKIAWLSESISIRSFCPFRSSTFHTPTYRSPRFRCRRSFTLQRFSRRSDLDNLGFSSASPIRRELSYWPMRSRPTFVAFLTAFPQTMSLPGSTCAPSNSPQAFKPVCADATFALQSPRSDARLFCLAAIATAQSRPLVKAAMFSAGIDGYTRVTLLRAFEKEPRLLAAVDRIVLRNRERLRRAGV